jgi:hypothetical protein
MERPVTHYIDRERTPEERVPGESAYLYAVGARFERGDCIVDRWVSQAEAVATAEAAYDEATATRLASCLGCGVTLFEAPPPPEPEPREDPDEARKRRVADHLHEQTRAALDADNIAAAEAAAALMSDEERAKAEAMIAEHRRRAEEQAAREAEHQRRASIAAAIDAGDEPAALALMTDEERAAHEERKRVAGERQAALGKARKPGATADAQEPR